MTTGYAVFLKQEKRRKVQERIALVSLLCFPFFAGGFAYLVTH